MKRVFKWMAIVVIFMTILQHAAQTNNGLVAALFLFGMFIFIIKLLFSGLAKLLGREATGFIVGTYIVRLIDRLFSRRQY